MFLQSADRIMNCIICATPTAIANKLSATHLIDAINQQLILCLW